MEVSELDEDVLHDTFDKYGPIETIELFPHKQINEKKYAHVQFQKSKDAYIAYLDRQRLIEPCSFQRLTVHPVEPWLQPEPLQLEANSPDENRQEKLFFDFTNYRDLQAKNRITLAKMRGLLRKTGEHLKEVEFQFNPSSPPVYSRIIFRVFSENAGKNLKTLIIKKIGLRENHYYELKPVLNRLEKLVIISLEQRRYSITSDFEALAKELHVLKELHIEGYILCEWIIRIIANDSKKLQELRLHYRGLSSDLNEKLILDIAKAREQSIPLTIVLNEIDDPNLKTVSKKIA